MVISEYEKIMCDATLKLTRTLTCELPFMFNLPSGNYTANVDNRDVNLLIGQEYFALYKIPYLMEFFRKMELLN
jgi:hypothetical protein